MDDSTEFVFIEEYHSDSDSIESEIILPAAKPRKRKTWQTAAVFQNRDEAIEWLKINQNWSLEGSYDTEAGRKEMYRCNHVKKKRTTV